MSPPGQPRWRVAHHCGQLSADQVASVLGLAGAAGDADGTYPLSEDVVLRLRHGTAGANHLLGGRAVADQSRHPGSPGDTGDPAPAGQPQLTGYAQVTAGDPGSGDPATAELFVDPGSRRRGLGRQLATAALAAAPDGRLRVWAHGDHPAAAALADRLGFRRARVLHQLRRPLTEPLPAPRLPEGVTVRAYRPGADDAGWLAVNARAFADHPEQGRWGEQDLRLRQAEPWFDPAGFLLAERADTGELLGFHWTKVHGDGNPHHREPIGEVYVLGVDPSAQGLGLGAALTLAGLHHLRGRGLAQVMLYVDGANTAALRLYRGLGFADWSVDVMYAHPG